jgi:PAS domain S-box-containing protein
LKLYSKTLLIFVILNVGIIGSVSIFLMLGFQDVLIDHEVESKTLEIIEKKQKIESFIESKSEKIALISTLPEIQGFLKFNEYGKLDNIIYSEQEWVTLLQNQFQNISNTEPDLQHIRIFDNDGIELVKLNIIDNEFSTTFESEKLNKDQKYFFDDKLFTNSVYVSNIGLNTKNGELSIPYIPNMTFATYVFDGNGSQMGLLVLSYDISKLLSFIEKSSTGNMIMIDQDGYIIQDNDKTKIFGRQLGTGYNYFAHINGLKNSASVYDSGFFVDDDSLYKIWNKLSHPTQPEKYWILIYEIQDSELYAPITSVMINSSYVIVIIIGITVVITRIVSKHVANPLTLLIERIHKAEKGELNTDVEIKGNDEIAKINSAFNHLTTTLQNSKNTVSDQQIKLKNQLLDLEYFRKSLNESTYFATSDIDGNFTYVNDKFCQNTQYRRDELIGKNPRILKSGMHDEEFYKSMWNNLLSGRVWIGDIKNKKKDDTYYWVKEILIPKKDADGKIIEFIIIQTDITSEKTAESKLSTSLKNLTKTQRLKTEFLTSYSSELHAIVISIRKLCQNLKYDELGDSLSPEQRQNVNAIYRDAQKMDFILDEFLGMYKSDYKKESSRT